MPNIHLTKAMEDFVQGQIKSGAYANFSEVVRTGIRLLMEKEGVQQFYALKSQREGAVAAAEAGAFSAFDLIAFEPKAFAIANDQETPAEVANLILLRTSSPSDFTQQS